VSGPLSKTFAVLAASEASEALDVLLAALGSPHESICLPAALALVERNGIQGQRSVLLRFPNLPTRVQQALQAHGDRFDGLLKQLLLHGDAEQRAEGLRAVIWFRAVDQIPHLVELLCRPSLPDLDLVAKHLAELVHLLDEDLRGTSVADASRAGITVRRDRALAHLMQAVDRYGSLAVKEPVIESILILSPPQHAALKKVMWSGPPDCRERAGRMLLTSPHPKVMRQTLESLRQPYPHPKAFEAVRTRDDVEFLTELLRFTSGRSNHTLEQNLRQIEHIPWLSLEPPPFARIPPELQPALLSFVFTTRVPTGFKAKVQDWVLRNGGPEGRMAAAEQRSLIDKGVLQDALVDSLDAEDEHVQAWAVTQLRQHAVPEAFSLLLHRLDSPSAEVRAAVREELSGFNLDLVLGMLNTLDAESALRVGQLLHKTDDDVDAKLRRQMETALRPKRIRAAQAAVKLGYEDALLEPLLSLARDADVMIRRAVAELLAHVSAPEAASALDELTRDAHPRVRETATHALVRWQSHDVAQLDSMLTS
jgi:hypothetical protein